MKEVSFLYGLLKILMLVMSYQVLVVFEKYGGQEKGQGKRGGMRVIYFSESAKGLIWLLTIYAKSKKENVPAHILKALKEELIDGYE